MDIDSIVSEKAMLNHPFYQAWREGKLNIEIIKKYAMQYFKLEAAFPTFLSAIHSNCSDREVRQMILQNMVDEEAGSENHAELWLRFCEGLGLTRQEVLDAQPTADTQKTIESLKKICSDPNFVNGVAAMYAYESQLPEVSKTKIEGLKKFYGITDDRSLSFFTTHEKADVWHSQVEKNIIEKHGGNQKEIEQAVQASRDALWEFLDGAYKLCA